MTATIMNKFTIQQLQQMRESEDRVEFKAGEGGNILKSATIIQYTIKGRFMSR